MAPIHNRLLAILRAEEEVAWPDASGRSVPAVLEMLMPYPAEEMETYPVVWRVDSPTVDDLAWQERQNHTQNPLDKLTDVCYNKRLLNHSDGFDRAIGDAATSGTDRRS